MYLRVDRKDLSLVVAVENVKQHFVFYCESVESFFSRHCKWHHFTSLIVVKTADSNFLKQMVLHFNFCFLFVDGLQLNAVLLSSH